MNNSVGPIVSTSDEGTWKEASGGPGEESLQTPDFAIGVNDEVVRRAQEGERAAFDELYEAHVDQVYGLCLRMTGDTRIAEELVQDVFVRAWQKIGTFKGASALSSWLYRVTVNVTLDARKKAARQDTWLLRMPDGGPWEGIAATADDPIARLSLERAISSLPDRSRMAIVLYAIEGYRYEEVAELMGVSVGTVKSHIHRARSLLLTRLDKRNDQG